jgi:hypothetical protein
VRRGARCQRQGVNADQLRESKALEKHTTRDAPQTQTAAATIQAELAYTFKENAQRHGEFERGSLSLSLSVNTPAHTAVIEPIEHFCLASLHALA